MTISAQITVVSDEKPRTILGVTHTNPDAEFLRLTEMPDGTFIVVTQNKQAISSFIFPGDTPPDVKMALRGLQVAMQKSNIEGFGWGTNLERATDSKDTK